VPFHFKQWGHWVPKELLTVQAEPKTLKFDNERPVDMAWVSKKLAGRMLEGMTWDGVPETHLANAHS